MNFASDNVAGASDRIMSAIASVNTGAAAGYGRDDLTLGIEAKLKDLFECDLSAFLVTTGTAANALALSAMAPPWGRVLCHQDAHVAISECGAPEFFTGGAKIEGLDGIGGKVSPDRLRQALGRAPRKHSYSDAPSALSISQATESGTVYSLEDIAALGDIAHGGGLAFHMDGARFPNALIRLGATPAQMTWQAGVDVLSFGATKNGCIAAEAVIFFRRELAENFAERRKRGGHLISKARFFSAQFDAYLADSHWRELASHANACADRLAAGLRARGVRLAFPVEVNELFPVLASAAIAHLHAAGIVFGTWETRSLDPAFAIGPDERLVRLVTSFATTESEVDRFLETLDRAAGG